MSRMIIDLTGQRFGRLIAVEQTKKTYQGGIIWRCKCDCGKTKEVSSNRLRQNNTKSCGCLVADVNETFVKENTIPKLFKSKISKRNKSGFKGVSWNKKMNKWTATIGFKRKIIFLGYFENIQDAIKARKEAEDKYFKPMLEKYSNQGVELNANK